MIKREIVIDGRPVKFCASAAVPRLYRNTFRRDIFRDIVELDKAAKAAKETGYPIEDLEMFENVAYIMAKHAAPADVPNTPEEWLDEFNTFSIYEVLPEIIALWRDNMASDIKAKKNIVQLSGR